MQAADEDHILGLLSAGNPLRMNLLSCSGETLELRQEDRAGSRHTSHPVSIHRAQPVMPHALLLYLQLYTVSRKTPVTGTRKVRNTGCETQGGILRQALLPALNY